MVVIDKVKKVPKSEPVVIKTEEPEKTETKKKETKRK